MQNVIAPGRSYACWVHAYLFVVRLIILPVESQLYLI